MKLWTLLMTLSRVERSCVDAEELSCAAEDEVFDGMVGIRWRHKEVCSVMKADRFADQRVDSFQVLYAPQDPHSNVPSMMLVHDTPFLESHLFITPFGP